MKNLFRLTAILALVLFISACSSGEEGTRTFTAENEEMNTTLVYYYEGDLVTKQTTENIINYEALGIETKEEAEEFFGQFLDGSFEDIDGISHTVDYGDDQVIETLAINYDEVDIEEIKDLPGMEFEGEIENGISMKETGKMLIDQGYEEVE